MAGKNLFVAELKKEMNAFRKAQQRKQDSFMKKQARQRKAEQVQKSTLRNDDFYYTDASKYAKKYYGETYQATTRFDNDWD